MKKIIIALTIIILFVSQSGYTYAQILTREQVRLDENLYNINLANKFAQPGSVLIVPIETPIDNFSIGGDDWYRGIYYYLLGRFGLGDVPFHYVVTSEGTVAKGLKASDEGQVEITSPRENPIVIAYLNTEENKDFSNSSKSKIEDLLKSVTNQHAITPDKIDVKSIKFSNTNTGFKLTTEDAIGRYQLSLSKMQETLIPSYSPVEKKFSISIVGVDQPTQAVNPQDEISIGLTIKNNSQFSIFQGGSNEVLVSKSDNSASSFFINGQWASPSQSFLMDENSIIKPQEEIKLDFKLKIPLIFGLVEEEFKLVNLDGKEFENTGFKISININRIEANVVEILDTETGSLNVRDRESSSGNVISTVLPGQRFIEISRTDNGWVQIDLGENSSGWVSSKYVKRI